MCCTNVGPRSTCRHTPRRGASACRSCVRTSRSFGTPATGADALTAAPARPASHSIQPVRKFSLCSRRSSPSWHPCFRTLCFTREQMRCSTRPKITLHTSSVGRRVTDATLLQLLFCCTCRRCAPPRHPRGRYSILQVISHIRNAGSLLHESTAGCRKIFPVMKRGMRTTRTFGSLIRSRASCKSSGSDLCYGMMCVPGLASGLDVVYVVHAYLCPCVRRP